jgi:putative ABC transport system permease protein
MDEVRAAWNRLVPEQAFNAQFLDDRFDQLYRQDRRFGQIFGTAAGLALFLACLGLLGLIAITARQRRREIGIRKALGASAARIVRMLSGEVVALVALATALGAPVAYLGMERWLDTFAVQMDLSLWWFLGAGLVVLLLSTAAASVHAVQAARINPAHTLKQE